MSYQPEYNSYISTDNSSTTLLADAATFTGTWEDVKEYDSIIVAATTDQDGIIYIDFSPDGTNVDSTLTRYYNTTDIEAPHRFTITRRYFRVRFTNDSGSAQTYLRLQSSVKASAGNLNAPIDGTLSRDFDAIATRPTDYRHEVGKGIRQGDSLWNKFGYNDDVDTGATEVIASWGSTSPNIMTTAGTLDVVSDDANDTSAGTGAQTVFITGIDANSLPQTESVTMNGTTAVTTSNTWLGVNRVVVLSSGSGGANAGTITIDDTAGTAGTQAALPAGGSVTQQCIFHTPVNTQFMADWLWFNSVKISGGGGSPVVTIRGYSYSRATDTTYEVFRGSIDTAVQGDLTVDPSQPFVIGGQEVLYFTASTDVNNTAVRARFSGVLTKSASAD